MRSRDFDAAWTRAERSHRRMRIFTLAAIALIWALILAAIAVAIWLVATTSPEQVGSFFGRIVAGFSAQASG